MRLAERLHRELLAIPPGRARDDHRAALVELLDSVALDLEAEASIEEHFAAAVARRTARRLETLDVVRDGRAEVLADFTARLREGLRRLRALNGRVFASMRLAGVAALPTPTPADRAAAAARWADRGAGASHGAILATVAALEQMADAQRRFYDELLEDDDPEVQAEGRRGLEEYLALHRAERARLLALASRAREARRRRVRRRPAQPRVVRRAAARPRSRRVRPARPPSPSSSADDPPGPPGQRRRIGELLLQAKEAGALKAHRPAEKVSSRDDTFSLADLGLTRDESSRAQKLAALERRRARHRDRGERRALPRCELDVRPETDNRRDLRGFCRWELAGICKDGEIAPLYEWTGLLEVLQPGEKRTTGLEP